MTTPTVLAPTVHVVAGTSVGLIPWVKLLQAGVWCRNVTELSDRLEVSKGAVLDSIEALNRVEAVTLGEVFRLRELATA